MYFFFTVSILGGCATEHIEFFHCLYCNEDVVKAVMMDWEDTYCCYDCAIERHLSKCHNCGLYYNYDDDFWEWSYSYCHQCYEDYVKSCFLCWDTCEDPAKIIVDNTEWYVCPSCITEYFAHIAPMQPCFYCGECGNIFSGKYYENGIFSGTVICENCVKECGYEKCEVCNKYFVIHDFVDGVCCFCIALN